MEIGKQIKKYRTEQKLSQDELADKIFVTRQTISNWENDKNYPDIKSLVMLSSLFGVSLDVLVKGDLEKMKEEIKNEDIKEFKKANSIMTVIMLFMLFSAVPLVRFFGWFGVFVYAVIFVIGLIYALRIEKYKKSQDIQTYKEISAFMEGKRLDEIEKQREKKKRPWQKVLLFIGSGALSALIAYLLAVIFKLEI
ncbi:MAG: helix-turn-helix transcriptional regulator [Oscillospiraceae bacterium]|nr:helix-turn-helix transcriptional regulator [Oscillospiraceae bacterium]